MTTSKATRVAPSSSNQGPSAGSKATIIFAEDEPLLRELGEAVLTRAGYKVIMAASNQAVKSLVYDYRGRVDLLLSDVLMPGPGGPELIAMVRARWPGIRVLYVSGLTGELITGLDPEAAFLQKPFTPSELLTKIAELLTGPASR